MIDRPSPSAPAAYIREFIGETAQRAELYARHAIDYADLGDDQGIARSLRCLSLCAVTASECLEQLFDAARAEKALRDAAKAYHEANRRSAPPAARGIAAE